MNTWRLVHWLLRLPKKTRDEEMTRTGETFGERAAYHRRGELSPGEHELARLIREKVSKEWNKDA